VNKSVATTAIRRSLSRILTGFHYLRSLWYFQKLKGKYKGRRGFVIGNGPSLTINDLDKLKNEITLASNKIYLAFKHTTWRPTFHTVVDRILFDQIRDEIPQFFSVTHLLLAWCREVNGCSAYGWLYKGGAELDPSVNIQFSGDLIKGVYSGATVTFDNLQFAVHLGLNPIYIIGCDHYYKDEKKHVSAGEKAITGNANNYFIEGYREKDDVFPAAPIEQMNLAFVHARTYTEKNNISIFNATRGGHLEVFERVSFDSLKFDI